MNSRNQVRGMWQAYIFYARSEASERRAFLLPKVCKENNQERG